jgi:hypothetical protein
LITLKQVPPHIIPTAVQKPIAVTVGTVRLNLTDVADFRTAGLAKLDFKLTKPGWIYPYKVEVPAREWLEQYRIGDMVAVAVIDQNTYDTVYVQTPLTQQMIDENSDVNFRFALSDH